MTSDPLLQALPDLLETKPELFTTEDLQDLDQTLAPLENDPLKNADEILRNWCKARRTIRDELIKLSSHRKELGKIPPSPPQQSARTENFFQELRQQVQQVQDKLNLKSR